MKKLLFRIVLAIIALFQSASFLWADDYSGRHVTDDEGGVSSFFMIIIGILLFIMSLFVLIMTRGRIKDHGDNLGCFAYAGLVLSIIVWIAACS